MSDNPHNNWPAVTKVVRPWATNPDQRSASGNRPNRADRMLEEVTVEIPGLIADQTVEIPAELDGVLERAVASIARVEARSEHLGGLELLLVRSEAVASSKIERVYSNMDDLARASIGAGATASARATIAASQALSALAATWADGDLTHEGILEAHQQLMAGDLLEGEYAGRYRPMQNWIGGSDSSPRGAVHVPPPSDHVRPLMDDLLEFARRTDMSAITQAALVHGQFEAIHPFTDGNGRIGRALIGAMFRRRGLTATATVPVAAAMLADVESYFAHLASYRAGNPVALVEYVAHCAIAAADAALESADRLAMLPTQWHERVSARRGSSTHALLGVLLHAPVLDITRAEAATGSSRRRTYEAIENLRAAGIVEELTGSPRWRVWVATDVMAELSELEERIGRRVAPSTRWL